MLSKRLLLCRRLDQYILPVEPQAFVRDLGALNLHGPKALHRVDEELKIASAPTLSAWASPSCHPDTYSLDLHHFGCWRTICYRLNGPLVFRCILQHPGELRDVNEVVVFRRCALQCKSHPPGRILPELADSGIAWNYLLPPFQHSKTPQPYFKFHYRACKMQSSGVQIIVAH
ncbi:hypothetical protein KC358_g15 [Hortaea werneckii]|nr:hypothetical protein KC358_g15 [Hortaea werneckii]